MGWVVNTKPWMLYPQEGPVLIVQETGCAMGLVLMVAESLTLHWDSIPRPCSLWRITVPIRLSQPRVWRFRKPKWQLLLMFARNAVHCGILKVYQLNIDLWFAGGVVAIGWLSSYVQDSVRLITSRLGTVTLLSSCESSVNLRNTDRSICHTKHQEFLHGVKWYCR